MNKSKCVDCNLECQFKGKNVLPKIGELVEVPDECSYKKEIQRIILSFMQELNERLAVVSRGISADLRIKSFIKMQKDFFISYKRLQSFTEPTRILSRLVSNLTPLYFTYKELSTLENPLVISKESIAAKFIERLKACPIGKEGWLVFQKLCEEILSHLFVPPLVGPYVESRTETGLHVRDLIFDIPYTISGFWGYIRDRFDSSAIIVECKNYSSPIGGNEIVIPSKYLGRNRLGRFGIILTRVSPSSSAIKEMKRLWVEENKLILCLTDAHLIQMLKLKEQGKEPEMVIDKSIHEFLRSLE